MYQFLVLEVPLVCKVGHMPMEVTILARGRLRLSLRLMLLSFMELMVILMPVLDTDMDMVLDMMPSPPLVSPTLSMLLLPPLLVSLTPPMLASAPTTWELLFPVDVRRGRQRLTPLFCTVLMDILLMPMVFMVVLLPLMLLLDMLLPTPDSELSTLPMLEFAPTTLVLRFLASHKKGEA